MEETVILYDKAKEVDREALKKKYPEGIAILLVSFEDNEEKALGEIPYKRHEEIDYYWGIIANYDEDLLERVEAILLITPTQKSDLHLDEPDVMSSGKFFRSYGLQLAESMKNYSREYGSMPEDMMIFYREDSRNNVMYVYGTSVEGDEVRDITDRNIGVMTYKKYCDLVETWESRNKIVRSEEEKDEYNTGDEALQLDEPILYRIHSFLETTTFDEFLEEISKRVKGQEELPLVLGNIYNYFCSLTNHVPVNNNMLLAAPSGCGKTETFRALREYFAQKIPELPVYQVDMTSITEEGFKGSNTSALTSVLLEKYETNGIGIVFMDEFDKKLIPSYSGSGSNVNAAVQAQILVTIEGKIVEGKHHDIDTSNTLFIGLGSFDESRKRKAEVKNSIGFGQEKLVQQEKHYASIKREDMIDLGASYELLGRFPMVVNYHKLSKKTVDLIIDGILEKLGKSYGYTIEISDGVRDKLHQSSNSKYGCRLLESMLRERVLPIYCDYMKNAVKPGQKTIILEDEEVQEYAG